MTSGGSRAARRAEQRPPGSSSSHSLCSSSGSTRRRGAHGRRTAAPGPPLPRPPPWRRWGSAGPCPVPKRCWDSRGICGWKLPNFLGRMGPNWMKVSRSLGKTAKSWGSVGKICRSLVSVPHMMISTWWCVTTATKLSNHRHFSLTVREDIAHLASLPWLFLALQYFRSSHLCPKAKPVVPVVAAGLLVEGSCAHPQAPSYSDCPKRNFSSGRT